MIARQGVTAARMVHITVVFVKPAVPAKQANIRAERAQKGHSLPWRVARVA